MSRPVVAIVGRKNVGKSALLNRLSGRRIAIVEDLPGTTRDRILVGISWLGKEFTLIDTAGLELKPESTMAQEIRQQVATAIEEANVILFMVDAKDGVIPADREIADMLRRANKPILVVANKVDNTRLEAGVAEFYALGLGEPLAISAYHARGTSELLDRIAALLPPPSETKTERQLMKLAIVGRPNVGKSSLLNAIVGEKRAVVDEAPGTTRDAIDSRLDFDGQSVLLIDTAGIRRPGHIEPGVERYSVIRALQAIDRADVALLVLDAPDPVTAQDTHIAGYIQQAEKGIILIVNKWDLITDKRADYEGYIRSQLKFLPYAPVLYLSARTGQGVDTVIPQALEVYQERLKRLPAKEVNNVVQEAVASHRLSRAGGRQLKILYASQAEASPPTFVFIVNDPRLVHFSYRRYLEKKLRQAFGFRGNPFRLVFKSGGDK